MMVQLYLAQTVTTNHGSSRAGFAGGKGDHGTGGGGGGAAMSGGKRGTVWLDSVEHSCL